VHVQRSSAANIIVKRHCLSVESAEKLRIGAECDANADAYQPSTSCGALP